MTSQITSRLQATTRSPLPKGYEYEALELRKAERKAQASHAEYLVDQDDFFTGSRAIWCVSEAYHIVHNFPQVGSVTDIDLPQFFAPFRAIMAEGLFRPGTEAAVLAAAASPNIRKLSLDPTSTNYTIERTTAIATFIRHSQTVEEVSLCATWSSPAKRLNDATVAPIIEALTHNRTIRVLRMNDTCITDAVIPQLVEALIKSPNRLLERIDLIDTCITSKSVPALVRLIEAMPLLSHVGIGHNFPSRPFESRELIYAAIARNQSRQKEARESAYKARLPTFSAAAIQEIEDFIK